MRCCWNGAKQSACSQDGSEAEADSGGRGRKVPCQRKQAVLTRRRTLEVLRGIMAAKCVHLRQHRATVSALSTTRARMHA